MLEDFEAACSEIGRFFEVLTMRARFCNCDDRGGTDDSLGGLDGKRGSGIFSVPGVRQTVPLEERVGRAAGALPIWTSDAMSEESAVGG
jgi:hypothetical protein